jgi:hypothetical protein
MKGSKGHGDHTLEKSSLCQRCNGQPLACAVRVCKGGLATKAAGASPRIVTGGGGKARPAQDRCQNSWHMSHSTGRATPLMPRGLKHFEQGCPSIFTSADTVRSGAGKGLGRSEVTTATGAPSGAGGALQIASLYSSRFSPNHCCSRNWDGNMPASSSSCYGSQKEGVSTGN